jgi:hypothetical protein
VPWKGTALPLVMNGENVHLSAANLAASRRNGAPSKTRVQKTFPSDPTPTSTEMHAFTRAIGGTGGITF